MMKRSQIELIPVLIRLQAWPRQDTCSNYDLAPSHFRLVYASPSDNVEKIDVGAASPSAWDKMIGLHPATVETILNESGTATGMI